jgi:hypothetical protein
MLHGACGTFRGEPAQGRRSFNYSSPLWGEGAEVACGDLGRRGAEAKAAPLPARLSVPSSPRWGEVTASAPAQTDSFSRRGRAPSPRVRGEGRDEGALPLGSEWQQSPHPRLRRDLSREGRGERINVHASSRIRSRGALMRPSFVHDHDAIPKIDSPPAIKEGAERRKAHANHRRHADKCAACARVCVRGGSAPMRGALAFRRSAAALARANASAVGSAPVPAFPET